MSLFSINNLKRGAFRLARACTNLLYPFALYYSLLAPPVALISLCVYFGLFNLIQVGKQLSDLSPDREPRRDTPTLLVIVLFTRAAANLAVAVVLVYLILLALPVNLLIAISVNYIAPILLVALLSFELYRLVTTYKKPSSFPAELSLIGKPNLIKKFARPCYYFTKFVAVALLATLYLQIAPLSILVAIGLLVFCLAELVFPQAETDYLFWFKPWQSFRSHLSSLLSKILSGQALYSQEIVRVHTCDRRYEFEPAFARFAIASLHQLYQQANPARRAEIRTLLFKRDDPACRDRTIISATTDDDSVTKLLEMLLPDDASEESEAIERLLLAIRQVRLNRYDQVNQPLIIKSLYALYQPGKPEWCAAIRQLLMTPVLRGEPTLADRITYTDLYLETLEMLIPNPCGQQLQRDHGPTQVVVEPAPQNQSQSYLLRWLLDNSFRLREIIKQKADDSSFLLKLHCTLIGQFEHMDGDYDGYLLESILMDFYQNCDYEIFKRCVAQYPSEPDDKFSHHLSSKIAIIIEEIADDNDSLRYRNPQFIFVSSKTKTLGRLRNAEILLDFLSAASPKLKAQVKTILSKSRKMQQAWTAFAEQKPYTLPLTPALMRALKRCEISCPKASAARFITLWLANDISSRYESLHETKIDFASWLALFRDCLPSPDDFAALVNEHAAALITERLSNLNQQNQAELLAFMALEELDFEKLKDYEHSSGYCFVDLLLASADRDQHPLNLELLKQMLAKGLLPRERKLLSRADGTGRDLTLEQQHEIVEAYQRGVTKLDYEKCEIEFQQLWQQLRQQFFTCLGSTDKEALTKPGQSEYEAEFRPILNAITRLMDLLNQFEVSQPALEQVAGAALTESLRVDFRLRSDVIKTIKSLCQPHCATQLNIANLEAWTASILQKLADPATSDEQSTQLKLVLGYSRLAAMIILEPEAVLKLQATLLQQLANPEITDQLLRDLATEQLKHIQFYWLLKETDKALQLTQIALAERDPINTEFTLTGDPIADRPRIGMKDGHAEDTAYFDGAFTQGYFLNPHNRSQLTEHEKRHIRLMTSQHFCFQQLQQQLELTTPVAASQDQASATSSGPLQTEDTPRVEYRIG